MWFGMCLEGFRVQGYGFGIQVGLRVFEICLKFVFRKVEEFVEFSLESCD